jgi:hypothetical protein
LGVFGEVFGREVGGGGVKAAVPAATGGTKVHLLLEDNCNSCSCCFMSDSNVDREQLNKFISSSLLFSTGTFEFDNDDDDDDDDDGDHDEVSKRGEQQEEESFFE